MHHKNCIFCKKPFEFNVNVFSRMGLKETQISGSCEVCWDSLFEESEGEEDLDPESPDRAF